MDGLLKKYLIISFGGHILRTLKNLFLNFIIMGLQSSKSKCKNTGSSEREPDTPGVQINTTSHQPWQIQQQSYLFISNFLGIGVHDFILGKLTGSNFYASKNDELSVIVLDIFL